jgi:CubicO group peptidase (beta-lactamase class C family)
MVNRMIYLAFLVCLQLWGQTQATSPLPVQSRRDLRAQVTLQNWDNGGELSRYVYLNATEIFPAAPVHRAGEVRVLPVHLRPEIENFVVDQQAGKDVTLREFVSGQDIDGFIILSKGDIVYEQYPHMSASDQHLVFSVTKAFVGTALGILEMEGKIDSNKPIEQYLPRLNGSAWAGTRVRDIADMASGMEGVEDSFAAYSDPNHKHYQFEASLGWQPLSPDMPETVRS